MLGQNQIPDKQTMDAPEERQWFHAWCLLFVFMCVFGSVVDIGMMVCLFLVGVCLRSNAFLSFVFFSLYMGIAVTRRSVFTWNNYPSLYALYIGPTVDPLVYSGLQYVESFVGFMMKCMNQVWHAIKNL